MSCAIFPDLVSKMPLSDALKSPPRNAVHVLHAWTDYDLSKPKDRN